MPYKPEEPYLLDVGEYDDVLDLVHKQLEALLLKPKNTAQHVRLLAAATRMDLAPKAVGDTEGGRAAELLKWLEEAHAASAPGDVDGDAEDPGQEAQRPNPRPKLVAAKTAG